MKKLLFLATGLITLASCSENDFVGDEAVVKSQQEEGMITFSTSSQNITRADDHVGADAAILLNKKFVVGGYKGAGDVTATVTATGTVFDHYTVEWAANTAATTESNTSDWEYVGKTPAVTASVTGEQTIKYWDYSADQYDFIAYSTGEAIAIKDGDPSSNQVKVTAIAPSSAKTAAYTLQGAAANLQKCYIADMVTVYKSSNNYGKEVELTFRSLASKVRMAIYETIPGYSVKNVKFYSDNTTTIATGASEDKATLFTTGTNDKDNFYTDGTYTVKFPTIGSSNTNNSDYNKAHVSFDAATNGKTKTKEFGSLNLVGKQSREVDANNYIGRTSATASFAGTTAPYYTTCLPNEEGTVLELRVDYTLLSIDGSGEEINVHGAKAFVPAVYAAWKPNYAYTYIFKISDNTNGWTSTVESDPVGLYPITFDAVVVDSEEHTQSTITTVATPSITTYQKGHDITKDEYNANAGDIYVQVMQDGTLKSDLGTKGQLYSLSAAKTEAEVMDALNIQASSTETTITGRNDLTLTKVTSDTTITTIPGADGNNITVDKGTAAKFTPTAPTDPATVKYYAYVYYTGTDKADTEYHTAVVLTTQPTDWNTADNVYYTDEECTKKANTTYSNGTYYQKYTNLNKVYGVKVIKVVAATTPVTPVTP